MDHEVRRIRLQEWQAFRELRLEALQDSPMAFAERYADVVGREDRFWQDRVERAATGTTAFLVVAVHDGQFVGSTGCFIQPEITAYVAAHVVGVYVQPRWRGHGIADSLLAATVRWASEEAKADRIRLLVTQTNTRAAAFYRRLGFVPTGVTVPYPPDPALTEFEMEYAG